MLRNLYEAKGSQAHPHTLKHETPTSIYVESLKGLASALPGAFHEPCAWMFLRSCLAGEAGEDAIAANLLNGASPVFPRLVSAETFATDSRQLQQEWLYFLGIFHLNSTHVCQFFAFFFAAPASQHGT